MTKVTELLEKWNKDREILETKEQIRQEKEEILKKRKKQSTTKCIVAFLFVNCTVIELYSMFLMYKLQDTSALPVLIAAVVTEVVGFAIYAFKALKENTKGGITYDTAMSKCIEEGEAE